MRNELNASFLSHILLAVKQDKNADLTKYCEKYLGYIRKEENVVDHTPQNSQEVKEEIATPKNVYTENSPINVSNLTPNNLKRSFEVNTPIENSLSKKRQTAPDEEPQGFLKQNSSNATKKQTFADPAGNNVAPNGGFLMNSPFKAPKKEANAPKKSFQLSSPTTMEDQRKVSVFKPSMAFNSVKLISNSKTESQKVFTPSFSIQKPKISHENNHSKMEDPEFKQISVPKEDTPKSTFSFGNNYVAPKVGTDQNPFSFNNPPLKQDPTPKELFTSQPSTLNDDHNTEAKAPSTKSFNFNSKYPEAESKPFSFAASRQEPESKTTVGHTGSNKTPAPFTFGFKNNSTTNVQAPTFKFGEPKTGDNQTEISKNVFGEKNSSSFQFGLNASNMNPIKSEFKFGQDESKTSNPFTSDSKNSEKSEVAIGNSNNLVPKFSFKPAVMKTSTSPNFNVKEDSMLKAPTLSAPINFGKTAEVTGDLESAEEVISVEPVSYKGEGEEKDVELFSADVKYYDNDTETKEFISRGQGKLRICETPEDLKNPGGKKLVRLLYRPTNQLNLFLNCRIYKDMELKITSQNEKLDLLIFTWFREKTPVICKVKLGKVDAQAFKKEFEKHNK
eukprot:NODE_58_length_28395_cov_1.465720.p2 type:complete len:616 gc:universal NODE_58_length_28395_cov_1.465720:10132-8285(-)